MAVATFEARPGDAFLLIDESYAHLKHQMVDYALNNLSDDDNLKLMIDDRDTELQETALSFGFIPTQVKEQDARLNIGDNLSYTLPQGFGISSVEDEIDFSKLNRVMWRGFNHDGPPPDDLIIWRKRSIYGPHQNNSLNIKTISPNGDYAFYCGMWYEKGTDYCIVEPVATDPDYRLLGLGKAAVLEGIRRCAKLGAKYAYVGSSQQFYYNIGFYPAANGTFWKVKD